MLSANELTRTRDFVEQLCARLVGSRPINIEGDANVGPLELDLRRVHRIADDQEGLTIGSDLISRVAGGMADDGSRADTRYDLLSGCDGLPLARRLIGLGSGLGEGEELLGLRRRLG